MADFLGLMKQAAELKSKMEAMQAELDQIEVEGAAGVVGIRSPALSLSEARGTYFCEESGPTLTVRLTGVAAGVALQAVEQGGR